LLEGSVKISNNNYTSVLKPGQQASLNQNGEIHVVNDADADDSVAWKDGLFQFTDASIQSIMRQAARWYDVEVSYEGQIPGEGVYRPHIPQCKSIGAFGDA
jgi:transmembrane sensor